MSRPAETGPCDDRVVDRSLYQTGQLLTAEDLRAEQEYLLDRLRSHNRLHGWGIVSGLKVTATNPSTDRVVVGAGSAVDVCGREIVVVAPTEIEVTCPVEPVRFVTIAYGEEAAGPVVVPGSDETVPTRIEEVPRLAIEHEPGSETIVLASVSTSRPSITDEDLDGTLRRMISLCHGDQ